MRSLRLILPALAALAAFAPAPGYADPYKWCAQYAGDGDGGGGRNCGFVTREQCMATVSGIGGYCEPNQFYDGARETTGASRRPARKPVRD